MSAACTISPAAGAVRSVLWSVDCNTREFARQGYEALAGGQMFQTAVTVALTIYIALVGYRLLLAPDGARLSDGPRMALKVGTILALVSSWGLFQTLVFDVVRKAPEEIAAVVAGPSVGGREALADPVGGLQLAYDQLFQSAAAFTKAGEVQTRPPATPAPDAAAQAEKDEEAARAAVAGRALANADALLLTVHTGLLAASTLAVEVLGALSPLFITLFLFRQTRGFFEGWVRALTASALVSVGAWILALLMLKVLDPWLIALAQQREFAQLDPRTGTAAAAMVEVFTAAQVALAVCCVGVAFAFRLGAPAIAVSSQGRAAANAEGGRTPGELTTRAGLLADQLRRYDQMSETRSRIAEARAAAQAAPASVRTGRSAAGGGEGPYRRPVPAGPTSRVGGRS